MRVELGLQAEARITVLAGSRAGRSTRDLGDFILIESDPECGRASRWLCQGVNVPAIQYFAGELEGRRAALLHAACCGECRGPLDSLVRCWVGAGRLRQAGAA